MQALRSFISLFLSLSIFCTGGAFTPVYAQYIQPRPSYGNSFNADFSRIAANFEESKKNGDEIFQMTMRYDVLTATPEKLAQDKQAARAGIAGAVAEGNFYKNLLEQYRIITTPGSRYTEEQKAAARNIVSKFSAETRKAVPDEYFLITKQLEYRNGPRQNVINLLEEIRALSSQPGKAKQVAAKRELLELTDVSTLIASGNKDKLAAAARERLAAIRTNYGPEIYKYNLSRKMLSPNPQEHGKAIEQGFKDLIFKTEVSALNFEKELKKIEAIGAGYDALQERLQKDPYSAVDDAFGLIEDLTAKIRKTALPYKERNYAAITLAWTVISLDESLHTEQLPSGAVLINYVLSALTSYSLRESEACLTATAGAAERCHAAFSGLSALNILIKNTNQSLVDAFYLKNYSQKDYLARKSYEYLKTEPAMPFGPGMIESFLRGIKEKDVADFIENYKKLASLLTGFIYMEEGVSAFKKVIAVAESEMPKKLFSSDTPKPVFATKPHGDMLIEIAFEFVLTAAKKGVMSDGEAVNFALEYVTNPKSSLITIVKASSALAALQDSVSAAAADAAANVIKTIYCRAEPAQNLDSEQTGLFRDTILAPLYGVFRVDEVTHFIGNSGSDRRVTRELVRERGNTYARKVSVPAPAYKRYGDRCIVHDQNGPDKKMQEDEHLRLAAEIGLFILAYGAGAVIAAGRASGALALPKIFEYSGMITWAGLSAKDLAESKIKTDSWDVDGFAINMGMIALFNGTSIIKIFNKNFSWLGKEQAAARASARQAKGIVSAPLEKQLANIDRNIKRSYSDFYEKFFYDTYARTGSFPNPVETAHMQSVLLEGLGLERKITAAKVYLGLGGRSLHEFTAADIDAIYNSVKVSNIERLFPGKAGKLTPLEAAAKQQYINDMAVARNVILKERRYDKLAELYTVDAELFAALRPAGKEAAARKLGVSPNADAQEVFKAFERKSLSNSLFKENAGFSHIMQEIEYMHCVEVLIPGFNWKAVVYRPALR